MDQKLLSIYLNDHLAGATAGVELARRARSSNRSSELGAYLDRLVEEIEEDRSTLLSLMGRLDIGRDRLKEAAGWAAEKVGRLKLNGSLLAYSPLSRVVELEALVLGVTAKRTLWDALKRVRDTDPRLSDVDLDALAGRADRQRRELEHHRLVAVDEALRRPAA